MKTKRVILFVVDALTESVTREWIESGRLPTLATLIARGGTISTCTSIFPSITPAATCSIATGVYPKDHGIEGACWFDQEANDCAYFGDDLRFAINEGLTEYVTDFADRLNFDRLRMPLIYEHLFEQGIESACINYMWFRGPHVHSRTTPLMVRLMSGRLISDIRGPKILKLGDFVHSLPPSIENVPAMKSGLWGHYGFHDKTTAACMLELAKADELPPFTLAYFPLNDDKGHTDGLEAAAARWVEDFDLFMAEFIEWIGGWDVVGNEYSFVIVGDHGQVQWSGGGPEIVRLDEALDQFQIADTGKGFERDDELMICPNMRSAAIYLSTKCTARDKVIETMIDVEGVDQVIYEEQRTDNAHVFTVATSDRGRMSFARACSGFPDLKAMVSDRYGNEWSIFGETSALDLTVATNRKLIEFAYPNALERIEGAFAGGSSPIWLTARTNAEFAIKGSSTHSGGSHGSLHASDSVAALITTSDVDLAALPAPESPRIVDVMDLCLTGLGAA